VRYGFGDASGSGFGSILETGAGLKYRIGVWGYDDQEESSNYKEFRNVVNAIEEEVASGNMTGSTLFFFTDNTTVEGALSKGNSSSPKLFHLVLKLRKLQVEHGVKIVVSHVSGKRMIAQGTDGVSRGTLGEGVAAGADMLQFIPLHLSALEQSPQLKEWLLSWLGSDLEFLTPTDWFTRGHDQADGYYDASGFWRHRYRSGLFLWSPPPGAAEIAIEELRKAIIKRQGSTHIFICPRLLSTEWRKQLHKAADLVISLPAGADSMAWPDSCFEPLTIGFVFPHLPFAPWQRRGTPKMLHLARTLPGLLKGEGLAPRDILWKFYDEQRRISKMPESLVRKLLYFTSG
jgi:hypothetical protein